MDQLTHDTRDARLGCQGVEQSIGKRRVMVLGATGFIGRNLVTTWQKAARDEIVAAGMPGDDFGWTQGLDNVTPAFLKIGESGDYAESLAGVNTVVYLVGGASPGRSNISIPQELKGIQEFGEFLESCVQASVGEVVFMSSGGTVYGEGEPPFSEEDATDPITTYGIEKLACEKLLQLFWRQHGLGYRIIRLSNPYGPFQNPSSGQGVIAAFVNKALRGQTIEVFGDGSVIRDFIYIEDAARDILAVVNSTKLRNKVVNVGSGRGHSISQIAEAVARATGASVPVLYRPGRKVDVRANWLDVTRLEELGPRKLTPIDEGIRLTWEWQRQEVSH